MGAQIREMSQSYQVLRRVFVAGLGSSLVLYFIPWFTPAGDILRAWSATGGAERALSSFDLCCLMLRVGDTLHGAFYLVLSIMELVLLVLAIWRPRRWVFRVGAGEQLLTLIVFLLRSRANDLPQPEWSVLVYYATWAMCFTGFFVRPPVIKGGPSSVSEPETQT